jgi:hypothetical protein
VSLKVRVYLWISWSFFIGGLIAWPSTHIAILLTKPPELASWTGHLLLAISWLAIIATGYGNIVMADVRKEQDQS